MKLQILVPQYNEPDEIVKSLLDSIKYQQNISFDDIGVIICNDGSNVFLSDDLIKSYPYAIEYHKEKHNKGLSGCRNACLSYATADYITFMDADDTFFDKTGLSRVFSEMNTGFESLYTPFVKECKIEGKTTYVKEGKRCTHVQGKFFQRKFLLDNNIQWNESLRVHEDGYFHILCLCLNKNNKNLYLDYPIVLWCWNPNSMTRSDPLFKIKTYKNVIESSNALMDELSRRRLYDKVAYYFTASVYETYYNLNKKQWRESSVQDYLQTTEKKFFDYYKKYEMYWSFIKDKSYIENLMRSAMADEAFIEDKTINQWLEYIENKYC